jgi:tetratricopeptide (TPR) repeat protein
MWIRGNMRLKFWLLSSILVCASFVNAAEVSPLPPEMRIDCERGFHSLYQMDYAAAKNEFRAMIEKDMRHPAGYVYLASAVWLERLAKLRRIQTQIYNGGNAFFRQRESSIDPVVEKLFYSTVEKGMVRAKMRLQKDGNDLAGLYYLGTAHGAIAGYESTIKRTFFSSLEHGTEAVKAHKRVIAKYPDFADAYVSIGMYNYVVGKLPSAVKILMMLGGVRGSKSEGLKQLERAAEHGSLARDEATVILVLLYDREKKHESALKLLEKLSTKYPSNPVFRFESATMHGKLGHFQESIKIYESLLKDEMARNVLLDFIHFEYAEILFASGNWVKAYEHYLPARRVKEDTPIGLITMSHLRSGQCLNAMGKHQEASVEYGYVLRQPDIKGSRDLAKKYLKRPYGT